MVELTTRTAQAEQEKIQGGAPLAMTVMVLEPSKRQPHVEALVMQQVCELTGDGAFDVARPLMEAGIDSVR
eukprot:UN16852